MNNFRLLLSILFLILFNLIQAQKTMNKPLPFSSVKIVDNLLFISGQVGIDPKTSKLKDDNFEAEVKQVMLNLERHLKSQGLELDNLVSTTIYLKDIKKYTHLNEIYGSFFTDKFPTRTCIAVADLPADASVEISGIASFVN